MLDEETKSQIAYLAKRKKYEELLEEKERLENEIFKNKHGFDKDKLKDLEEYFKRSNRK